MMNDVNRSVVKVREIITFLLFLSRATERDDEDKWEADQDDVHRIQPGVFVAVV